MAKVISEFISELGDCFNRDEIETCGNFIFINKPDWDYLECLKIQEKCADLIYKEEFKRLSVIIFTSHPSCLTLGRGLQKKLTSDVQLIDFDQRLKNRIKVPLFEIKRGGGITFHHKNQLIIYPIINLTVHKMKIYPLMSNIFRLLTKCLESQGVKNLDYCRDLLGLWSGEKKVASIGVQLRRFVSFHGVALNLDYDEEIQKELSRVFPCGLPGEQYSDIKNLFGIKIDKGKLISEFQNGVNELIVDECSLN